MRAEQEQFDRVDFLIKYVATKAPLPYWMTGFKLYPKELEELDQVQKTAYGITKDMRHEWTEPNSIYGRVVFTKRFMQALEIVRT